MKNKVIFPFILLMLSINYFFVSCDKDTDCKVNVKCVDDGGTAVQNAAVQLYANVKTAGNQTVVADIKANGTTDAGGMVSFVFKLPAIYDIVAKTVTTNSAAVSVTLSGTGIIKLEEGKTVEKIVTIK